MAGKEDDDSTENPGNKEDRDSTENPENRIELERLSADTTHAADILAHPGGEAQGKALHPPLSPRAARKAVREGKVPAAVSSTGHSWDGIEEYDNPLPRWWLWIFYATIAWALVYTLLYPAWPLIRGATPGLLGWSTRGEVAAEIERFAAANAPIEARLVAVDLTEIAADPELAGYTANAGRAIFSTWCAQCHGAGAAGGPGYPNLLDNDWLWGGDIESIHWTISHGIRNTTHPQAHYSEMPRYGVDGLLEPAEIDAVVEYVLALSGQPHDAGAIDTGAGIFADNCAACHMEDGTGDPFSGAPNLADAIWLYGGDRDSIRDSVHYARFGVMPGWNTRLSEAEIRAVAAYVHGLGGGE